MAEKAANKFVTSLTQQALAAHATIHVAAAAPAELQGGEFRAILHSPAAPNDDETVLVTGGQNGLDWAVTRAIEGPGPVDHPSGAQVVHVLTDAALDLLIQQKIDGSPLATDAELAAALAAHVAAADPHPAYLLDTQRGAANGVASLDAGTKVPTAQIPSVTAAMVAADVATQAELDAHVNDTSDAHDASAVSVLDAAGLFAAGDVEAALAELGGYQVDDHAMAATETFPMAAHQRGAYLGTFSGPSDLTVSGLVKGARIEVFLKRGSAGAHLIRIKETGGSFVTIDVSALAVGDVAWISGYFDGSSPDGLQLRVPGTPGAAVADASTSVKGVTKLSVAPVSAVDPIAVGDNDPRNTDQRVPTNGSVTDAKVAGGAAIAESKLALASDAAAGVASRRTLGTGALQAAAGDHVHAASVVTVLDAAGHFAGADVEAVLAELFGIAAFPPIYRLAHSAGGRVTTGPTAPSGVRYILASPTADAVNITGGTAYPQIMYRWTAADQAVAGKTTKLRIKAHMACFGTAPGQTITVGLYPATYAVSSSFSAASPVVSGSTVPLASATGQFVEGDTGDFTPPADGPYVLGYEFPAQLSAIVLLAARLEVRNV